jgi:hypothetical protein
MSKVWWRVYRVEDKSDLEEAVRTYQMRTGQRPRRARVSQKSPELQLLLQELHGLRVEIFPIPPRDIWLTHEEESEEES